MLFHHNPPAIRFNEWFWHKRANTQLLLFAGMLAIIHFIWFKLLYPFPNFAPDSYRYILAAFNNSFIDMRPIGYSRFLRFFSCFTTSHLALVSFQYLLLQSSILYFVFSICYLLNCNTRIMWALTILCMCNPLISHLSNFLCSDALFTALSLTWFTQILWLQYRPSAWAIFAHIAILFAAFTVRYSALYYPVITGLAIILAPLGFLTRSRRFIFRFSALVAMVLPLYFFVTLTKIENKRVLGTSQFSPFSGWQIAANALSVYAHIPREPSSDLPASFRPLHDLVNKHMDSLDRLRKRPDKYMNVYYMWNEHSPLNTFTNHNQSARLGPGYYEQWASFSVLYNEYGNYLIKRHPFAFIRYFMVPNSVNFFRPNPEFLGIYNTGSDSIGYLVVDWFELSSSRVYNTGPTKSIVFMKRETVFQCIISIVFLLLFSSLMIGGIFRKNTILSKKLLLFTALVWMANFAFSIFSSIVVLRYQTFSIIVTTCFDLFFILILIDRVRKLFSSSRRKIFRLPVFSKTGIQ